MKKIWFLLPVILYFVWHEWPHPAAVAAKPRLQAQTVRQDKAWIKTVSAEIHAVGNLFAEQTVILRPEIIGKISQIHKTEGQSVHANDVILDLNSDEQNANLAQSLAQEEIDRLSFERIRDIRDKKLASQQDYDQAMARLKNSKAIVERDRVRLSKTRIRAPFDGVLGTGLLNLGDYVNPGQALINLEAIDPIKLDFKVPEKYASQVNAGLKIGLSVEAYPGRIFTGEVYAVDPKLDEATRSLKVRARLKNPDAALRPGMFAKVDLNLGAVRNAIFIPEQALLMKGSQAFVFRIDQGKALQIPVKTGDRKPGSVEITEGLQGDESIVTDGQLKLRDGMEVRIINPSES